MQISFRDSEHARERTLGDNFSGFPADGISVDIDAESTCVCFDYEASILRVVSSSSSLPSLSPRAVIIIYIPLNARAGALSPPLCLRDIDRDHAKLRYVLLQRYSRVYVYVEIRIKRWVLMASEGVLWRFCV